MNIVLIVEKVLAKWHPLLVETKGVDTAPVRLTVELGPLSAYLVLYGPIQDGDGKSYEHDGEGVREYSSFLLNLTPGTESLEFSTGKDYGNDNKYDDGDSSTVWRDKLLAMNESEIVALIHEQIV